jgi:hypothetical protein
MNLARIAIVKKWIESTTRWNVRTFLKFVEFYRRFIKKFSKIIRSLTNFLKERKKKKFDKKFEFTKEARIAFAQLKDVFIKTSILLHFASKRKIRLKIDAFDFAILELCLNWSKKRVNDISSRSFFEKCSLQNKIMKSKKLKCSSWLNRVEFFDITSKMHCFLFKCWSITLISIRFLRTKNWTKKNTMMKQTKWSKSSHRV